MVSDINGAFLNLALRAESSERKYLVETFVDAGALFTRLQSRDHQILFGRRGTGKTHALAFLADTVENKGDIVVQIDMRQICSNGGTYADTSLPLSERATRLMVDTFTEIHDHLRSFILSKINDYDLSVVGPHLDTFAQSVTEVKVIGDVEQHSVVSHEGKTEDEAGLEFGVSSYTTTGNLKFKSVNTNTEKQEIGTSQRGLQRHRLHFGSVRKALEGLLEQIYPNRLWLLLDEWSEVPFDLQPILADLLKRTVLPTTRTSVKIAAIEQRSQFLSVSTDGVSTGIEMGADIASSLSLDDFMVFNSDAGRAKEFFGNLLLKHIKPVWTATCDPPTSLQSLTKDGFTQQGAFDEFVRASEGVPRDAISIISFAAEYAGDSTISVPNIRQAASRRYQLGKESAVTANVQATKLLRWIIDEVIGHRRARAFLLQSDVKDKLIDTLFDARVLHIIKHGVSSKDAPGARYNVYVIDFGCYVDLINTNKEPKGLFEAEEENIDSAGYVDVPKDDYRSIRRAVLDLDAFYKAS